MLDAYVVTIDYDHKTFAEARQEVASYLDQRPLLDNSVVYPSPTAIVSACLVSQLEDDRTAEQRFLGVGFRWLART